MLWAIYKLLRDLFSHRAYLAMVHPPIQDVTREVAVEEDVPSLDLERQLTDPWESTLNKCKVQMHANFNNGKKRMLLGNPEFQMHGNPKSPRT